MIPSRRCLLAAGLVTPLLARRTAQAQQYGDTLYYYCYAFIARKVYLSAAYGVPDEVSDLAMTNAFRDHVSNRYEPKGGLPVTGAMGPYATYREAASELDHYAATKRRERDVTSVTQTDWAYSSR